MLFFEILKYRSDFILPGRRRLESRDELVARLRAAPRVLVCVADGEQHDVHSLSVCRLTPKHVCDDQCKEEVGYVQLADLALIIVAF